MFIFALSILLVAFRGRPAIDWAFGAGGARLASAARSPRLGSFFREAWDALDRLYARLKGSPVVPKAVGIGGGLIAYFFSEPRRLAAWGSIAASLYALIAGLAMGTLPSAFGGFVLLFAGVSCAQYHFSVIAGQQRALAFKQFLGSMAFKLIPAFFVTLVVSGVLALGLPGQQGAGAASMVFGFAIAAWYFSSLQAFRDAAWLSFCEYEEMLAAGSGGFSSIDIAQRILSQLPPTSLNIEPVIEALQEQLAGDIPEPPEPLFDLHRHYAYRQSLKDSSFATPEAEALLVQMVAAALLTIAPRFPKLTSEPLFTTTLEEPIKAVLRFMEAFQHPRAVQLRLLERLRSEFLKNIVEVQAREKSLTDDQQLQLALKDTPFLELFRSRLPYELQISIALWYAHTHICAPTGAFKTQLTQTLILHLVMLFGDPSFMVIDSQGPILELLESKFGPQLKGSVLKIHPYSHPVGINPFDIDFSGMTEQERGSRMTEVADLFVGLFATGSSELSDKMRTLFDQMVRLFLIGIPAVQNRTATMSDLDEFMDCPHPREKYKRELEHLDDRRRIFFSKHNYGAYAETRTQVHQRLFSVLRDPGIEKMLCAERNELDLDRYLDAPGLILVDTDSNALKRENSRFLGRFFVLLAQQALMRRMPEPQGNPHPAFVVADEAQQYFKAHEVIEQIIDEGRKRHFGMILVHHRFSQAPAGLQDAFEGVGVHFASEVVPADLARLAQIMKTKPAFLMEQRTEEVGKDELPSWIDYALYYRGRHNAISVRLKHGNLENFDTSNLYRGARSQSQNAGGQREQKGGQSEAHASDARHKEEEEIECGKDDIVIRMPGHPGKMRNGGKQRIRNVEGRTIEIEIPPGWAYGKPLRIRGALRNNGTLWIIFTEHSDLKPENYEWNKRKRDQEPPKQSEETGKPHEDDMDTGAAPWPC
jgi:hypothetical protein